MRKLLQPILFLSVILLANGVQAQTITFNDETYNIQNIQINDRGALNEYLLPGDSFDNYKKMLAFRVYHNQAVSPLQFAQAMAAALKKQHPEANYKIIQNQQTGEVIIDFITWGEGAASHIVEFNLFKLRQGIVPGDLLSLQYVFRNMDSEKEKKLEFLNSFKKDHAHLLELLAKQPYPSLVAATK